MTTVHFEAVAWGYTQPQIDEAERSAVRVGKTFVWFALRYPQFPHHAPYRIPTVFSGQAIQMPNTYYFYLLGYCEIFIRVWWADCMKLHASVLFSDTDFFYVQFPKTQVTKLSPSDKITVYHIHERLLSVSDQIQWENVHRAMFYYRTLSYLLFNRIWLISSLHLRYSPHGIWNIMVV